MNKQPIGIFDSGLGGLTAVKELMHIMPYENVVYFGDTSRVPYGNRSRETIQKYARQDARFLLSQGVKMVIAACGTVSSVAANLGDELSVPFTGVVKPTSLAASKATKNGRIGVIGTTATIKSSSYKRELSLLNPEFHVFEQDCPLFVPLVENGYLSPEDPLPCMVAERYLSCLKDAKVDTVILGCTHYPILSPVLQMVMGDSVTLIDSGRETALFAAEILKQQGLRNESRTPGTPSFFVSDRVEGFSEIAGIFLGQDLQHSVSRIDIESY